MIKKLAALALCALFCFVVACASKSADITIGVLLADGENPAVSAVMEELLSQADALGSERGVRITLDIQNALGDKQTQQSQADVMFAKRPAVVYVDLADDSAAKMYAEKAADWDISLNYFHTPPGAMPDGAIFVGDDPGEMAAMQGNFLAERYRADRSIDKNGDGKIQYLTLVNENSAFAQALETRRVRAAGESGLIIEPCGEALVCGDDIEHAKRAMADAFQTYGTRIEAVFAHDDVLALSAAAALSAQGYNTGETGAPHIFMLAMGISDASRSYISDGKLDGTVACDAAAMAKALLTLALNRTQNGSFGKEYTPGADGFSILIPPTVISK